MVSVHISELSDDYVENPADVVKPQDIVSVRVISVDEARGRIGFSMKSEKSAKADKADKSANHKPKADRKPARQDRQDKPKSTAKPAKAMGSFGALLQQAGLGK